MSGAPFLHFDAPENSGVKNLIRLIVQQFEKNGSQKHESAAESFQHFLHQEPFYMNPPFLVFIFIYNITEVLAGLQLFRWLQT